MNMDNDMEHVLIWWFIVTGIIAIQNKDACKSIFLGLRVGNRGYYYIGNRFPYSLRTASL